MLLVSLFTMGCVHAPIPLDQEGQQPSFRDPAPTGVEAGWDIPITGANAPEAAEVCELALATALYLDPAQELSFCAPDSAWVEGASYEANEDGIFFAFAAFGTWNPGDDVVEGGETEITIIGNRGDWVAADLAADWQAADIAAGYNVGEVETIFVAGLEGYALAAGIPAGTNDSFPSGGTMISFVADVPEGVLTFFVGYGQYSANEVPKYLSLTWDSLTAADITAL